MSGENNSVQAVRFEKVDLKIIEEQMLERLNNSKPKSEKAGTAEALPLAPQSQISAETKYALDKILNDDGKTPKRLVPQQDLNDLLNDKSMIAPQSFEPNVVQTPQQNRQAEKQEELLPQPQEQKEKISPQEKAKTEWADLEALLPDELPKAQEQAEIVHEEKAPEPAPQVVQEAVTETVAKKAPEPEEKTSLLYNLLEEAEAAKKAPKKEVAVNKFDDRADKAVRGVGDAVISPFKALSGIKNIVTGDFDKGQKEIRNAVADFANAPAQAANLATTFAGVIIDDIGGETAEKIITAPAKAVSGIWETGVALVKPEEGSVKNAFNKMTFGIFN